MKQRAGNRLGVIIGAYASEDALPQLLAALEKEKLPTDRIVVIDNHPEHASAAIAKNHQAVDVVIESEDTGYAGGGNLAAAEIAKSVDLLLFLTADTLPAPGSITKLRNGGKDEWGAWMGLLTLPDGRVNSGGNAVHISGLSWCLNYGIPADKYAAASNIDVFSGADFVIRSKLWQRLQGFGQNYFMYYEDTDLSFRVRSLGYKIGIVSGAKISHDYVFSKNKLKWFHIERNRYIFILRTWPVSVILVLLPVLVVSELGLWAVSILQRRCVLKVRSTLSFLRLLPATIRDRRSIQASNKLSGSEFLDLLQPTISTPFLPKLLQARTVSRAFLTYYIFAKRVLAFSVKQQPASAEQAKQILPVARFSQILSKLL